MSWRAPAAEVLTIFVAACVGASAITALLLLGCGPPRGTTFLLPLNAEPQSLAVRFETVEPADATVVAMQGPSWQRVGSGSVIRVEGAELDLVLRARDFDGPIYVSLEVLRDDVPVGGAEVIAEVPAILVRGDYLRLQEWRGGHPRSPSRLLSLEYKFHATAAEARHWAARAWWTYLRQTTHRMERDSEH